jgi:hypothetical protein
VIRTGKITAVAVLALIGGGLALLFGWLVLAAPKTSWRISGALLLFGIWGVATGLGVLRLKRWARLSVFIFAGLSSYLIFTFWPLVILLHFHTRPGGPELGVGAKVIILLLLAIVLLAGLWIGYALAAKNSRDSFGISSPAEPFRIAVIGWYLVISGIFQAAELVRFRNPPRMFFGFVFTGWSATGAILFFAAVHLFIGIGLFLRKEKIRRLAIYYCIFQLCDIAVFYLRPDRDATVRNYFHARVLYIGASATPLSFDGVSRYLNFVSIEWGIITLIGLWCLLLRKGVSSAAFATSQQTSD